MSIRSASVTSSPIPKRKRSRIQDLCAAWSISKSVSNGFGAHWVVLRVAEEVCSTYRAGRRLMKLDIFFATRSDVLKPSERIWVPLFLLLENWYTTPLEFSKLTIVPKSNAK